MHTVMDKEELKSMVNSVTTMSNRIGKVGDLEPEDIAQMALIKLLLHPPVGRPGHGWIYRVVKNIAMDAAREFHRNSKYLSSYDFDQRTGCVSEHTNSALLYQPAVSFRQQSDFIQNRRAVLALKTLSKPLRDVLILQARGFSYEQIASITCANLGSVRSRIHYARRQAQKLLAE